MKKYIIDGEKEFQTTEEAADYVVENIDDDVYDEMLDECYGDIEICGYSYSASLALYRVDEIAYRCGRNDYFDGLRPDILDELDNMDSDDTTTIYGLEVEFLSDEEDEEE